MKLKSTFESEDFLIEIKDGIPIVKINIMRVTIKEVKAFKQTLDFLLSSNYKKIIIDFTECIFADSSIIGVMINIVKEVRKINGDIIAVAPAGSINNVFAQTGLNKIFKQFDNVENALASLSL